MNNIPNKPQKLYDTPLDYYIKKYNNNNYTRQQLEQKYNNLEQQEREQISNEFQQEQEKFKDQEKQFNDFFKREHETPVHLYLHKNQNEIEKQLQKQLQKQQTQFQNKYEYSRQLLNIAKQQHKQLSKELKDMYQKEWEKIEEKYQQKMFEYHKQFQKNKRQQEIKYFERLPMIKNEALAPQSAFSLWFQENKDRIKAENKGSNIAVLKKTGKFEFSELSRAESKSYFDKEQQVQDEYDDYVAEWNKKYGDTEDKEEEDKNEKSKKGVKRTKYIKRQSTSQQGQGRQSKIQK